MRNQYAILTIFILMITACTRESTTLFPLSFTFDGKPERFEKVEATYFLNCGITPTWRVQVEQGDRFFRIEWTKDAGSFWYTYHGKSFAEGNMVVNAETNGEMVSARFHGLNVRDGIIHTQFINQ